MSEPVSAEAPTNAAEYTVSEISGALKRTVEDVFGHVRVRGEISGYRGPHSSGHAYFCLKDERARLDAVVWKTTMARLKFRPEEGLEVIAGGRLTTYPGKSTYQIVIDRLEPAGAGALMALLEERKRRLAAEGVFAAERKRPLPFMPRVIGVVTSPTGAVIRDIVHRIADRFPLHVLVWPVRVQGETAGAEATRAVEGFNALEPAGAIPRPDLIIVARGGGSLEDLWGFNDEGLVRAVAGSAIPVISAVGHETDWTLIDLAADLRAPTPTGAAELAVPVRADLEARLATLSARLRGCMSRSVDRKRQSLRLAARALPTPDQVLALPRRRFDEAASGLARGLVQNTARKRARFAGLRLRPASLARRLADAGGRAERAAARLDAALARLLRERRRMLAGTGARNSTSQVATRAAAARRTLDRMAGRLDQAAAFRVKATAARVAHATRLLETLSYRSVLARGFAVVRDAAEQPVREAGAIRQGQELSIEFADGRADAVATDGGNRTASKARAARPKEPDARQGSLL